MWTVACYDVVLVLVVGNVVLIVVVMITRLFFGRSKEEEAVQAELNKGLQDGQAGAGYAD